MPPVRVAASFQRKLDKVYIVFDVVNSGHDLVAVSPSDFVLWNVEDGIRGNGHARCENGRHGDFRVLEPAREPAGEDGRIPDSSLRRYRFALDDGKEFLDMAGAKDEPGKLKLRLAVDVLFSSESGTMQTATAMFETRMKLSEILGERHTLRLVGLEAAAGASRKNKGKE